jgi:hypothetical protein
MNNDTELLELSREVYERTGWKDTYSRLHKSNQGLHTVRHEGNESLLGSIESPLYTSDYILEKLPEEVGNKKLIVTNGDRPYVGYAERDGYGQYTLDENFYKNASYSDNVLKALLKLTIALHKSGELPDDK